MKYNKLKLNKKFGCIISSLKTLHTLFFLRQLSVIINNNKL